MSVSIGIDLGTTNSVIAFAEHNRSRVLPTRSGDTLTPSVVGYYVARRGQGAGEFVVGSLALDNAARAPRDTVFSIKRLMGRAYDDPRVREMLERFGFRIEPPESADDSGVEVLINEQRFSPVKISAMILRKLKEDAQLALGEEPTHVVITVPAYFEERQRAATRQAGEEAGFIVKRIIDEPTAAAIAFGASQSTPHTEPDGSAGLVGHRVLVYDLGGGTFDISIIQILGDQYQVLHIDGDPWLGGDDFDSLIVNMITEWVRAEYEGYDPRGDPRFLMQAKREAERAKKALSQQEVYQLVLPSAGRTANNDMIDIDMEISRADFERLITPFVDHSIDIVKRALLSQNLKTEDITQVLLVGGSTAVPLVRSAVVDLFGETKVKRYIDPMHCVALGASLLASSLAGIECPNCHFINEDENAEKCVSCGEPMASGRSVGKMNLSEVTARTLGIGVVRGDNVDFFQPIIPRGTPYPLSGPKRQDFRPSNDNQQIIRIPVFEGEDPRASQNELQGVLEFKLPQGVDSSNTIAVGFNYDRNREVTISIRVLETGYRAEQKLARTGPGMPARPSSAMGDEENWVAALERAMNMAQIFTDKYETYIEPGVLSKIKKDLERAEQARQNGDEHNGKRITRALSSTIFNAGVATQLFTAEGILTSAPPEIAQGLVTAINRLKEAFAQNDKAEIQQLRNILQRVTERIIETQVEIRPINERDFGNLLRLT